jgi:cell division control protein 6
MALQVVMKPLNSLEFAAACSTLADMGIISLGNAREERLKKVGLKAHKEDVALALQDVRLLRNLLSLV